MSKMEHRSRFLGSANRLSEDSCCVLIDISVLLYLHQWELVAIASPLVALFHRLASLRTDSFCKSPQSIA